LSSPEQFERFAILLLAGIGMVLAGGLNLVLCHSRGAWRLLATGAVCGGVLSLVWVWADSPALVASVALVMAAGLLVCSLPGSVRVGQLGSRLAGLIRRPTVRWAALLVAGVASIVGSAAVYQAEEAEAIDRGMSDLGLMTGRPGGTARAEARATTDRGSELTLLQTTTLHPAGELDAAEGRVLQSGPGRDQVIRRDSADQRTNCHGWVFTAGRFWVSGETVGLILEENGYEPVSDPMPGDLVIYRVRGTIAHSAVVRYVTDGQPVLVEGKWGAGGVYLHAVDKSSYGTDFTYFRSPRGGHLLTILDSPVGPKPPTPVPASLPGAPLEHATE
jgi:hypothetical protein